MNKKIHPVDRYELRQALLNLPGIWVCGSGYCIPVEALNKAIDDLRPINKTELVDYIVSGLDKDPKSPNYGLLEEDLQTLLAYNEVREYIGMRPLNGHDEYLDVEEK